MDDTTLIERLRADADRFAAGAVDADVEALVRDVVTVGRRRRTRRRVAGAVSGFVVAALAATAIAVSVPMLRTGQEVDPVAPPSAAATTESPVTTPTPASTGQVSGSPGQVRATLTRLLPADQEVTAGSADRDEGTNGFAWENSAAVTVRDSAGTSYLFVSVGNGGYVDGCLNLSDCEQTTLPDGGTLWITSSPPGDKAGVDRSFQYNRPDGGHISMMERNYAEGNGPVTRDGLPLSDAAGRALVLHPEWDALFRG